MTDPFIMIVLDRIPTRFDDLVRRFRCDRRVCHLSSRRMMFDVEIAGPIARLITDFGKSD
jgi:hypothetical protein